MSRRSLRIDDSLLDRGLPHSSASFSLGGAAGWKIRSRSSRRLSSSCSESLLAHTPHRPPQNASSAHASSAHASSAHASSAHASSAHASSAHASSAHASSAHASSAHASSAHASSAHASSAHASSVHSSGVHSVAASDASDASLLSSLLDESRIQESTAVDGFWGLDCDADPKESTMVCESTILANSTLIGPDTSCLKPRSALIGPELSCCKCSKTHCDSKHSGPTFTNASTCSSASVRPGLQSPEESGTVYCKGRRHKGAALWLWIRRWFCCFLSVLIGLNQNLQKLELKDVMRLWLDSSLFHLKRAALFCGSALSLTWRHESGGAPHRPAGVFCAGMKESKDKRPNGALCSDRTQTVVSVLVRAMVVLWSAVVFTGQRSVKVWRWIRRRWSQNKRFPLGFVLFLLLLFAIFFSLLWFGLSSLSSSSVSELVESELPFLQTLTSKTESTEPDFNSEPGPDKPGSDKPGSDKPGSDKPGSDKPGSDKPGSDKPGSDKPGSDKPGSDKPGSDKPGSDKPGLSRETAVQMYKETDDMEPEAEPVSTEETKVSDLDSSRLERLEQSLSSLWRQLEVRGHDPEADPVARADGEDSDLEQQLDHIRTRLEQDHRVWAQTRQRDSEQQQKLSFKLEQIQRQLDQLIRRTQDLELKQASALRDASVPAALRSDVDSQDGLFTELSHLQGALQSVTRDVQALSGCRGTCAQLQDLQQTVQVQVQEQVRSLVFGSLRASEDSFVSLLQFMSERFVSDSRLQGALSALELRLKKNIHRPEDPPPGGAVTQEDVQEMIHAALRLFSEDRTGRADYALESGGGSIVSSRCSQTFETKAALLSLFGIPLWHFSQSPRAVIQPDVHPGNCWPFRGSSGFFMIRLSARLVPSSFSLEHIPKSLSPTRSLSSAPRDFSVYGLRDEEEEEGKLLGTFVYDRDGEPLQTYTCTEENHEPFQFVLVKVSSNWGHEDYTCVYRFRVHGTPVQTGPGPDQDQDQTSEQDQDQTSEQDQDQTSEQDQDQTSEPDQDQDETSEPDQDQTSRPDQDQEKTPENEPESEPGSEPDQDQVEGSENRPGPGPGPGPGCDPKA